MYADDAIYLQRWATHRDPDAFREIVSRYAAMVFATAKRVIGSPEEAEDVAQECFQALACIPQAPSNYLGPWLHRVATNIALQKRRASTRRRVREEKYAMELAPATHITWNDIYAYVDEAIELLPEDERTPLVAHYLEGHSQTDIALRLNIPRQTVNNRIHKGVERIRQRLHRKGIQVGCTVLGTLLVSAAADAATVPGTLAAGLGKIALSGAGTGIAFSSAPVYAAGVSTPSVALFSAGALKSAAVAAVAALAISTGAVFVSSPGGEQSSVEAAVVEAPSTPEAVLDAYSAYQKRIARMTVTYEMSAKFSRTMLPSDPYYARGNGSAEVFQRGEVSSDGHRVYTSTATWGSNGASLDPISNADPLLRICGFDGRQDYQWDAQGYNSLGSGSIGQGAPLGEHLDQAPSNGTYYALWGMNYDSPAWGYVNTEGRRIDTVLRESPAKSLRSERIGGQDYYVVEAETPYGTYTAWFDPHHGYNVAKMQLLQRTGHASRPGDTNLLKDTFVSAIVYTVTEFTEVDGLWIAKEYTRQVTESQPNLGTSYSWDGQYVRTSIQINPDFDALGTFAFMRGVPEGSEWWYRKMPGEKITFHEWRNGSLSALPDPSR